MGIPRNLDLRIKGHLREIEQANDEVIGDRQGLWPAVDGYRRTLESVADCATAEEIDEVAEYIKEHIRPLRIAPSESKGPPVRTKSSFPSWISSRRIPQRGVTVLVGSKPPIFPDEPRGKRPRNRLLR